MPLTQEQLDTIEHMMNAGDGTPEEPSGIQHKLSAICQSRDHVFSLTKFHTLLDDATATNVLATLRTRMKDKAQEIVDILA